MPETNGAQLGRRFLSDHRILVCPHNDVPRRAVLLALTRQARLYLFDLSLHSRLVSIALRSVSALPTYVAKRFAEACTAERRSERPFPFSPESEPLRGPKDTDAGAGSPGVSLATWRATVGRIGAVGSSSALRGSLGFARACPTAPAVTISVDATAGREARSSRGVHGNLARGTLRALRSRRTTYDRWPSHRIRNGLIASLLDCVTALEALIRTETEISLSLVFRVAARLGRGRRQTCQNAPSMERFLRYQKRNGFTVANGRKSTGSDSRRWTTCTPSSGNCSEPLSCSPRVPNGIHNRKFFTERLEQDSRACDGTRRNPDRSRVRFVLPPTPIACRRARVNLARPPIPMPVKRR